VRYPNKTLSGVGMVYKFCQYIDQFMNKSYADNILDLVAIGMVSDMMDLRNFETRELISLGTTILRNPFIVNFVDE
jgi:single-stranded-DNA-specific exonuclease